MEGNHGAKISMSVHLFYQFLDNLLIYTWASLHCCQDVTVSTPLFTFCIRSWEGTSLPQNSACGVKCFAMWVKVPVFHYSSPTTSISELVYEMHVRVKVLSPVTLLLY